MVNNCFNAAAFTHTCGVRVQSVNARKAAESGVSLLPRDTQWQILHGISAVTCPYADGFTQKSANFCGRRVGTLTVVVHMGKKSGEIRALNIKGLS
jgi:hypothetical protein